MTIYKGVELCEGPELMAGLVAHAVNSLDQDEPCCPHVCAPCAALFTLHDRGALTAAVGPYVTASGADWDWWTDDNKFDWQWLLDRWCDLDTCEDRAVPLPADQFDWIQSR
jgi:hypothetical protein